MYFGSKIIHMSQNDSFLTSAKTAALLGVHESSVKRWCNANTIPTELTEGGHRRIRWSTLLDFAQKKKINIPFKDFDHHAFKIYEAVQRYIKKGKIDELYEILLNWTRNHEYRYLSRLVDLLCNQYNFKITDFIDHLLVPSLIKLGDWWEAGDVSTAEEHLISNEWLFALSKIRSRIKTDEWKQVQTAMVACSDQNIHDIPAQCIRILLEQRNVKVEFLGTRTPVDEINNTQSKMAANLICISFSPIDNEQTINNTLLKLANEYDDSKAYALVIGGINLHLEKNTSFQNIKLPFEKFKIFPDFKSFDEWLELEFIN